MLNCGVIQVFLVFPQVFWFRRRHRLKSGFDLDNRMKVLIMLEKSQ